MIHRKNTEAVKACVFVLALCLLIIWCLFVIFDRPIVLGTEMNTDGQVEYLCLGAGCENLTDMDW